MTRFSSTAVEMKAFINIDFDSAALVAHLMTTPFGVRGMIFLVRFSSIIAPSAEAVAVTFRFVPLLADLFIC